MRNRQIDCLFIFHYFHDFKQLSGLCQNLTKPCKADLPLTCSSVVINIRDGGCLLNCQHGMENAIGGLGVWEWGMYRFTELRC